MPLSSRLAVASIAATLPLASSYAVGAPSSSVAPATSRCAAPLAIADMIKPTLAMLGAKGPADGESLGENLPNCPSTIWTEETIDLDEWQAKYKAEDLPTCPVEIHATPEANAAGADYFIERRDEFKAMLQTHGTIWFRGFDMTKDPDGFRTFWESLGMDPCLDPIHSSGLRKFLSKSDALYEEVNKQSLSRHYIGLHQEMTEKRTATSGAFVCFQPATVSGGEFFIADGERIFRDLEPEVLQKLVERKIRISVSNLDLDVLGVLPGDTKDQAMDKVKDMVAEQVAPKFDMDLEMIYGADGKPMRLQAVEQVASPLNRHPKTGELLWFCNIHNHARYLRDRRPCTVPEVGMTEVYHGDLSAISSDDLDHINAVSEKNIAKIPMQPGDVLLVDNYRILHGRDTFKGDRYHAVSWFGGLVKDRPANFDEENANSKPGDMFNKLMNKYLVDSF